MRSMTRSFRLPALGATAAAVLLLAGCNGLPQGTPPETTPDLYEGHGSLTGGDGGINILGSRTRDADQGAGSGLGVNAYLWRATLDTIGFMPIASADPFGGVILTDWYSPPETPAERMKVNAFILDRTLRADGIRVTVFRQTRANDGSWQDAAVSRETARQLEDTILSRAREYRVAALSR